MTPQRIEALFARDDGRFVFAHRGRSIAPAAFGGDAETLSVVRGAFEAMLVLLQRGGFGSVRGKTRNGIAP